MAEPLRSSVWIAAPPDRVFPFFAERERLCRWLAEDAEVDPRPGGRFAVDIRGTQVRGEYVELSPPGRVVFTWGHPGSEEMAPGATTVEVLLTAAGGGTDVTLLHHGLPASQRASHERGWAELLGILAQRVA